MVELNLYVPRCGCNVIRIDTLENAKRIGNDIVAHSPESTASITYDCGYCAGGKVNCGNCGGQGCDRCNGTGQVDCLECDGLGEKTIEL